MPSNGQNSEDAKKNITSEFEQSLANALAKGDAGECLKAGDMLSSGNGTVKNERFAAFMYVEGAKRGNHECAIRAGNAYMEGMGATKDASAAAYYYSLAGKKGRKLEAKAMKSAEKAGGVSAPENEIELGEDEADLVTRAGYSSYRTGDLASALTLYSFAAGLGSSAAYNNIGAMYEYGKGAPRDIARALCCYLRSAELGSGSAYANLAKLFVNGEGIDRSPETAFICMVLAKANGRRMDDKAVSSIARAYPVPNEDIYDPDHRRDRDDSFIVTADYLGDPEAQLSMWRRTKRSSYLMMSACQGDADAMLELARLYKRDADFVERNGRRALAWLTKSADKGSGDASLELAMLLANSGDDMDGALFRANEAVERGKTEAKALVESLKNRGARPLMQKVEHDHAADAYETAQDSTGIERAFLIYIAAIAGSRQAQDDLMIRSGLFDNRELNALEEARLLLRERAKKMIEGGVDGKNGRSRAQYIAFLKKCADEKRPGRDYDPALYATFLTVASAMGDVESVEKLADLYRKGEGVTRDAELAYKLNVMASRMGSVSCMASLAEIYEWGRGTPVDKKRAKYWRSRYWTDRYSAAKKS